MAARDRLRDDERLSGWLARVAYNAAVDHLRARAAAPLATGANGGVRAAEQDEGSTAKVILAEVLRPFVAQLPEPCRQAVTLSELEGLPHGPSPRACRSRCRACSGGGSCCER